MRVSGEGLFGRNERKEKVTCKRKKKKHSIEGKRER